MRVLLRPPAAHAQRPAHAAGDGVTRRATVYALRAVTTAPLTGSPLLAKCGGLNGRHGKPRGGKRAAKVLLAVRVATVRFEAIVLRSRFRQRPRQ